jgi:hypothetical protein
MVIKALSAAATAQNVGAVRYGAQRFLSQPPEIVSRKKSDE